MTQIITRLLVWFSPLLTQTAQVIGQADGPTNIFVDRAGLLGLSAVTWGIILVIMLVVIFIRVKKNLGGK